MLLTFIWLIITTSLVLLLYQHNQNKKKPLLMKDYDYDMILLCHRFKLSGNQKNYHRNFFDDIVWLMYDGVILNGNNKKFDYLLTTKLIEIKNIDHNYIVIYNFTNF